MMSQLSIGVGVGIGIGIVSAGAILPFLVKRLATLFRLCKHGGKPSSAIVSPIHVAAFDSDTDPDS